ncbi:hypothetical protein LQ564_00205 [Massilia sp. G4R7]|uniref:Uncharacterized protein n=1 Tax=Massilia phyllostachyos TaxID=2898585 RepID=A0ABS8PZ01_9BURK|nr:hypothetical protein [Massilia phyllostachyos]MCD2514731.1 hypothetical protein [Massilia phyllostachyos]
MPSNTNEQQPSAPLSAENRFRQAFERLKFGDTVVLKSGTPVTQNNVAREAGCDPSALKKSRFPALIREIQAYIELHPNNDEPLNQSARKKLSANRSAKERLKDAILQRDHAQSALTSANMRIIELTEEVQSLQRRLDDVIPPPKRV